MKRGREYELSFELDETCDEVTARQLDVVGIVAQRGQEVIAETPADPRADAFTLAIEEVAEPVAEVGPEPSRVTAGYRELCLIERVRTRWHDDLLAAALAFRKRLREKSSYQSAISPSQIEFCLDSTSYPLRYHGHLIGTYRKTLVSCSGIVLLLGSVAVSNEE